MWPSYIKKLVLAAALAVMPLQGIAATLTVLLCHGDAQIHGAHATASHGHGDHQAAHQHEHGATGNDESGATSQFFHLCCNLTASAPPSFSVDATQPDFPVRASLPDPMHDLFVPDRPQRPPLA